MNRFAVLIIVALSLAAAPARGQGSGFFGSDPAKEAEFVKVKRDRAERNLAAAMNVLDEAHTLVQRVREELLKVTGRVDVSAAAIRKSAAHVEEELESLQLDAVGAEARLAAIEKTVAAVALRAKDAAKSDDVAAELGSIVAAREQALAVKQKLRENNVASEAEVQDARAALAEARARMAERRQTANAATGGGGVALSEWNREMFNLSHDAAERRARIKYLSDRLDHLRAGLPLVDRLGQAEAARDEAAARLAAARATLDRVVQQLDDANARAAADAAKIAEPKKEERPK